MCPFLGVVLVLFFGLLASAVAANNTICCEPKVRREWRNLSPSERIDWMNAVNVPIILPRAAYGAD